MSLLKLLIDRTNSNVYLCNILVLLLLIKQPKSVTVSPLSHLKIIIVKFQLNCQRCANLLSTVFTKSERPNLIISPTQSLTRHTFLICWSLINPQIGRLPLPDLINRELSLFWNHKGCHDVWFDLTSILN